MITNAYKIQNMRRTYNGAVVFNDISASIEATGIIAIMGPSGSGKSTLLRLLSFLDKPDAGTVELALDGISFDAHDPSQVWPKVTCVFQKQFLWPHLTVRENIELPLRLNGAAHRAAAVEEMIELFAMSGFLNRYPNEVSVGQAQRGALARAFVLRPQVLLMDEAHSSLDLIQQSALNRCIKSMAAAGTCVFAVTHSIEFARRHADRVLLVDDSSILEIESAQPQDTDNHRFFQLAVGSSGL